jgi:DNA (cytosine-5)-methyltransferase 1
MAFSMTWAPQQKGIVLDGFAGPGGWSEGIRRYLGLHDVGLEWDEAATLTRKAAGHTTIRVDVSCFVLAPLVGRVWGLLMSPPCTKFSTAGNGFGNRVMAELAEGIRRMMRGDDCRQELRDHIYPVALEEQEKANAERKPEKRWTQARVEAAARQDTFLTVLVLEPARYLHALLTGDTSGGIPLEWVAFEQVPSVLPLWQVYAEELRLLGWSAWAGVLNSANFGVPQTRRRAILIASRVRTVAPPEATHYDPKAGMQLWGDPWVTMAEALDLASGQIVNTRGERTTPGGNEFPADEPSQTLTSKARSWTLHTNRNQQPDGSRQTTDPQSAPAPALTSKSGGQWVLKHNARANATVRTSDEPAATLAFGHARNEYLLIDDDGQRMLTKPEGSVLQSFPVDYPWQGTKTKAFEQIGNAVPPLLAAFVASAATGIPVQADRFATAA